MNFRFARFELDTRLLELRRDETLVPTEPRVFDVLRLLIENRDRVVRRDELIDNVWDGRVISEATLNSCMNAVRRAVGDDGKRQEFIRTLPRRGFRFVQPVRIMEDAPPLQAKGIPGAPDSSVLLSEASPEASLADKPSIAILPFRNISGDPGQEYFAAGITEDIIAALSRIRWFLVIGRNSGSFHEGRSWDVRRVSEDLGARYVLEGSVRKAGGRVRIAAQLMDGATGDHIWAERYDRDLEDVFAVQDEITQTVVGAIEPEISRAEQERARLKPPENMNSWDCYLHGLWHVWRFNKLDNPMAQKYFERAIAYDPGSCAAHAGLAYAHEQASGMGFSQAPERSLNVATQAARTAIALDERDAFACWSMGGVHFFRREYDTAMEWLRRSVALNPSFAPTHVWLGNAQISLGRYAEGVASLETAERLSPKDPFLWLVYMAIGLVHLSEAEFEPAEAWGRRAVATPNANIWAYCVYAAALGNLGRRDEARAAFHEMLRIKPDFSIDFLERTIPTANEQIVGQLVRGLSQAGCRH